MDAAGGGERAGVQEDVGSCSGLAVPASRCYDVYIMMARTQILLDPQLLRRARHRAADQGISLGEYVRRLLERDLGQPRAVSEPSAVFNLGKSGGADIASQKDQMIGEAVAARYPRPKRRK